MVAMHATYQPEDERGVLACQTAKTDEPGRATLKIDVGDEPCRSALRDRAGFLRLRAVTLKVAAELVRLPHPELIEVQGCVLLP